MVAADVITVWAPDGIGEIAAGADLVETILTATAGQLRPGDIVVVTSKIISKAEGRWRPAGERVRAITTEAVATVAWRGDLRIVRTRTGLVLAAAGVDNSNVPADRVLLLPADPDASARRLRDGLSERVGGPIGVVVSDTAGRAWRLGQTDQAIGAAGLRVLESSIGRTDPYGNPLQVSVAAVADELAAAADLAKQKLTGRPVAVVRGLSRLVEPPTSAGAVDLVRPGPEDLFGRGTREAVVGALLSAAGRPEAYEELVGLEGEELVAGVLAAFPVEQRELAERILRAAPGIPSVPPAGHQREAPGRTGDGRDTCHRH